nr:immunoglobulin light chain junction region [Macaca mulatta]MOX18697.1 immunoglobulin light chain junction region [Macaca mulatta]MOX18732.1 immunoglobulin light chain junction region [Macaca mulatta]MOX19583.1 immunoglobulin light chain junction region [Macaca mulatta]MOX20126.1 immunoglobulin light chain junction region [Macaca mulatta]
DYYCQSYDSNLSTVFF